MTTHANQQQIIDAFAALTPAQRKGLRLAGDKLAVATGFEGGCDLMQEALLRMLDGRRKWPLHLKFDFYVFRVMDSVAHGERKRHGLERWLCFPFDGHCDEAGSWRCPAPTPEQAAIAAEELRLAARAAARARLMLMSDLDRAVMDAVLEGETRAETCSRLGLPVRDYDLARQRVMGRLRAVGLTEGLARPAPARPKPKADGDDGEAGSPPPAKPSRRPRR
jgi:DNA-directed RNA polymerase specialized sigma24 family protein